MNNIAVFASGSGTNAENLINYFSDIADMNIKLVLTNNTQAGVLKRAARHGVESYVFSREEFYTTDNVKKKLLVSNVDYVILAGFLWLVPEYLIDLFPGRIINIHPALLPKYGGKGMYGMRVHQAVIENKEAESGITIHLVNNEYDKGNTIFQATCPVHADDTPEKLAERIHELEYKHFPVIVESFIREQNSQKQHSL